MRKFKGALTSLMLLGALTTAVGCSSKSSAESKSSSQSSSSTKKSVKKTSSKKKKAAAKKSSEVPKEASASSEPSQVNPSEAQTTQAQSAAVTQVATSQPASQPVRATPVEKAQPQKSSALWSDEKNQRLSAFMKKWQAEMGQTYVATYDGQEVNHYGFIFPADINNQNLRERVTLNGQPINLTWSNNGNNGSEYQVVAAAIRQPVSMHMITYLFTLHNGKPAVYYTPTTNGGILRLFDTENAVLQNGFANIINS
ncbi:DUF4767 domain-containing protein [Xylocopilactobacillus apicola]|uniref:DUF4767 domain-containing protein n=1 Tax=Xylocopilactobacillus apicola TaxID=2932184 RepID=A0AAU9DI33_9LACO|nr:DUF4767 domain-containing protein [Xylocopilactobacillus apicola]BDR57991.1 hypothetical protein XA3_04320 [Xylocopilactobacillus apicola]